MLAPAWFVAILSTSLVVFQLPRPAVEKLGPELFRLGEIRVDTAKREISVNGFINDSVETLEFVANTQNGAKAYESALTLSTDAINFNAALLLIGLDPSRGRPSKKQFDPTPPQGDAVEITVELRHPEGPKIFKIEDLLYDQRTKSTLAPGPWVYTGSTMVDTGFGPKYLAELDGVLIGLMHGPQAIIDNPRNDAVNGYGSFVLNPQLRAFKGGGVTLKIKALNQ
jgi:hypothetical protein